MKRILTRLFSVTACLCLHAQADSVKASHYVMRSAMFGVGHNNLFETYLSPLEYTGAELRFVHEGMRMTRLMNGKVSRQSLFQVQASYTENISQTANMYAGMINWSYALHYQHRIGRQLKLLFGPMIDLNCGVVYNQRNSNNPAQAKAYGNLGASAMLIYKFQLFQCPFTLRYQANLPLLGLMFSPEYGESYYEIFSLKHGGRNVVFTSLHNQPSLRQMLTLDFPIRSTVLRTGCLIDIQQAKVNQLKSHSYSFDFMIGFVRNFQLIRGKRCVSMPEKVTPF